MICLSVLSFAMLIFLYVQWKRWYMLHEFVPHRHKVKPHDSPGERGLNAPEDEDVRPLDYGEYAAREAQKERDAKEDEDYEYNEEDGRVERITSVPSDDDEELDDDDDGRSVRPVKYRKKRHSMVGFAKTIESATQLHDSVRDVSPLIAARVQEFVQKVREKQALKFPLYLFDDKYLELLATVSNIVLTQSHLPCLLESHSSSLGIRSAPLNNVRAMVILTKHGSEVNHDFCNAVVIHNRLVIPGHVEPVDQRIWIRLDLYPSAKPQNAIDDHVYVSVTRESLPGFTVFSLAKPNDRVFGLAYISGITDRRVQISPPETDMKDIALSCCVNQGLLLPNSEDTVISAPGQSGSAIVDSAGKLIGIRSGVTGSMSVHIPAELVMAAMSKNSLIPSAHARASTEDSITERSRISEYKELEPDFSFPRRTSPSLSLQSYPSVDQQEDRCQSPSNGDITEEVPHTSAISSASIKLPVRRVIPTRKEPEHIIASAVGSESASKTSLPKKGIHSVLKMLEKRVGLLENVGSRKKPGLSTEATRSEMRSPVVAVSPVKGPVARNAHSLPTVVQGSESVCPTASAPSSDNA